ncbi:MAG: biotin/lipoyl-binding protein [Candidatus Gracilibacteria bacterium]|nr:biotin/lipoyl-binding protein [Candidatus Gracilibacteria bacterium]
MKIGKKSIIIILILIIGATALYFWNKDKQTKIAEENKAKLSYTVKKGNIVNEVKVTATAKLADEQNLSFGQEGKITKVYVKVGDQVKAGEILAELNLADYENAVKTSQLELENAKLGLTKLLNNDTSLRESQLKSIINETQSNYDIEKEQEKILKQQLDTIVQQKRDQLEQLTKDYNLSKKNLEVAKSGLSVNTNLETEQTEISLIARKQTINNIINSLNTTIGDIENIVESVDKIFGVSEQYKYENDDFENYLGVKNLSLKTIAENDIIEGYKFIQKFKNEFKSINIENSDKEIYDLIQNYYTESIILVTICDDAIDSIEQSIESIGSLSNADINNFKATVNASRNSAISLRSQLEAYSTSINNLLSDASQKDKLQLSINQKQLDYEKLETSLNNLEQNIRLLVKEIQDTEQDNTNQLNRKKSQIEILLEKINVSKKELEDLLDGADEYDIKQQQNLINQSQLRLERTIDQKDNYQIIAEFDGRVRSIDIVEGEQYKLDDRKYIVLENPNLIELESQVSQIDIVKIHEKNDAIVTFDAYPYSPIKTKIYKRSVNPEPNTRGGFYYKTTILLEKQSKEILAGMTAIVDIQTAKADNVVLIPTLSIVQELDKKYVYLKQGENYNKHEIKTGVTNNFQAEVIEGLVEGDIIRASVLDTEALKSMGIDDTSSSIFGG